MPKMNDSPAASVSFRLVSEIMSASATSVTPATENPEVQ